ncbi:MAG: serine/threonine protein kinase, partial [Gemmatimonadota bacterium]
MPIDLPQRFTPIRRLGEGSFGTVHEALDTTTGERVALKHLRRFDSDGLLRFKREFRALADIRHENLVRFGELVSEGDEWLFTMELVDGIPLLAYVTTEGRASMAGGDSYRYRFDESRLRSTFSQLVEGVHAIHGAGLLHRDLKPPNVLVTPEGRVVILDFGLVVHLREDNATRSTQVVGTPAYMSPEQANGKGASTPSDWYTMGLMLFEALTGGLPFEGSAYEMIVKRHTEDPPRPSARSRSVPKDLDELCHRLIARDPDARPAYAELSGAFGTPAVVSPAPRAKVSDDIFVGRVPELARLREAFQRVQTGGSATVLIGGSSGIGKSALVRHFLEELEDRERDVLVLRGRCYWRESVPYKAFDGLIDDLTDYLSRLDSTDAARFLPRDWPALARLFPVLRELGERVASRRGGIEIPDAQEARRRGFAALRELLGRLGDHRLLVLSIDDLQWGDIDSGRLLRELTRPPDQPPILLLATFRSDERDTSPIFEEMAWGGVHAEQVWEIDLGELSRGDAVELALAHLGGGPEASRERAIELAEESAGIPFFMNELIHHGGSEASGATGPMDTVRLDGVIGSRLDGLPEDARRLLECFAVAGRPLDLAVANQAAGLDPGDTATVDLLRVQRWVRVRGGSGREVLEPYHDRIRETVAGLLPSDTLSSYHDRLAHALDQAGEADAETLAEHYARSGDDELAARHALRAADQATEALAFDRAARLYEMGFDLWEPT